MRAKSLPNVVLVVTAYVLILACGCGGGATSPPPPTVTRPPSPTPTRTPSPTPTPTLPDLAIIGTPADIPTMKSGTTVHLEFLVTNYGKRGVTTWVWVACWGNHRGGFNGLQPGETKVAIVDYAVYGDDATHSFTCMVDPDNVLEESNENNNESLLVSIHVHDY